MSDNSLLEFNRTQLGQQCITLLFASYCYYMCNISLLSDDDYDQLSLIISDNWDNLHPQWKWTFVNKDDIRATGVGMRMSALQQQAARNRANRLGLGPLNDDHIVVSDSPGSIGFRYFVIGG